MLKRFMYEDALVHLKCVVFTLLLTNS